MGKLRSFVPQMPCSVRSVLSGSRNKPQYISSKSNLTLSDPRTVLLFTSSSDMYSYRHRRLPIYIFWSDIPHTDIPSYNGAIRRQIYILLAAIVYCMTAADNDANSTPRPKVRKVGGYLRPELMSDYAYLRSLGYSDSEIVRRGVAAVALQERRLREGVA